MSEMNSDELDALIELSSDLTSILLSARAELSDYT